MGLFGLGRTIPLEALRHLGWMPCVRRGDINPLIRFELIEWICFQTLYRIESGPGVERFEEQLRAAATSSAETRGASGKDRAWTGGAGARGGKK